MISQSTLFVAIGIAVLLAAILLFRTAQDLLLIHKALRSSKQSQTQAHPESGPSISATEERPVPSIRRPAAQAKRQGTAKAPTYSVFLASSMLKQTSSAAAPRAFLILSGTGTSRLVSHFEIEDMRGTSDSPSMSSPEWGAFGTSSQPSEPVYLQ